MNFWFVSSLALLKETSLGLLVGWRLAVSIIYSTFKRAGGARTVEGHNSGIIGFNDRDLIAMILGLCASLCIYMLLLESHANKSSMIKPDLCFWTSPEREVAVKQLSLQMILYKVNIGKT